MTAFDIAPLSSPARAEGALPRRRVLAAALSLGPALAWPCRSAEAAQEPPLGWARPPAPPPAWHLTAADGSEATMPRLVGTGQLTAVQLMFTGCGTTCPTQGLLFATLAARPRKTPVRWLSISIDVLSDDPARLRAWQRRFGTEPTPQWQAAVPTMRDVDAIAGFLRGVPARSGTHTNQVFVFDRQGRLAYRTGDDPAPEFMERLLQAMSA